LPSKLGLMRRKPAHCSKVFGPINWTETRKKGHSFLRYGISTKE